MSITKVSKVIYNSAKFNAVQKAVDSDFNGRFSDLMGRVSRSAKDFIGTETGSSKLAKNLLESFTYPILGLPRDIFDFFARKLGSRMPRSTAMSKINKWKPLANYRRTKRAQQTERVLKGIYEKISEPKSQNVGISILKMLNENAAPNVAKYNTRDGEGLKRLVTGLIPIPFLFRDSFYISKKNNIGDEEAKKQAWNKANQELIAAGGESISQFTILGGMPRFINSSQFAAPFVNTAIGIGFHIISRLRTGRKLTHLSKKQVAQRMDPSQIKNLNDFKKYSLKQENLELKEPKKDGKKRLLSVRNLFLFAATSIVGGFALAAGKNKALDYLIRNDKQNKTIAKMFWSIVKKYENLTSKTDFCTKEGLEGLTGALEEICSTSMINKKFNPIFEEIAGRGGKTILGTSDRTIGNAKIPVKKLIELPFVPIRMLFEIASYPYKAAKAILEQTIPKAADPANPEGIRKILEEIGLFTSKKNKDIFAKAADRYDISHLYNRYSEFKKRHNGNTTAARKDFKKFLDKNFTRTFDLERTSKIDNSKIGKLTQLLGMTGGIYFATNDDYNQTLLETGSIRKAQVDQRRRGVQKFTRVATGVAISDWFNQTFVRNYNNSLLGTVAVVAASTFVVDKATRFMLGQPSKKLTDEELKEFEEDKKKGFMAPFYNFMDKLAK